MAWLTLRVARFMYSLSDEIAEHIPGCNMAYRLDRLRAIGGFDPVSRLRETMLTSAGASKSAAGP